MKKHQDKYRIPSNRLEGFDYGANALYFVTICTKNRVHHFGKVIDTKMNTSAVGEMADKCWRAIPEHFPFVILHNHVIMPNHVHGIIEIAKPDSVETQDFASGSETQDFASDQISQDFAPGSETQNFASAPETQDFASLLGGGKPYKNKFGPQSKNLASIVRGFKIGVTKCARPMISHFAWQPNYHDHIIRNEMSYQNISRYIENNPAKWTEDRFYRN
ncbi:MAG: transposase [Bacteroidia bacterium]